MMQKKPHYKKIYTDLIDRNFHHKKADCREILDKEEIDIIDVIQLNQILSDKKDSDFFKFNQQHRAYDQETIFAILEFQKNQNFNNTQLSRYFKISRSTIGKWKKFSSKKIKL